MANSPRTASKETFWRTENKQIFVHPPVIRLWAKVRLVSSVVIAMLGGALAVMALFRPDWFRFANPQASHLLAPVILLLAVGQMMLVIKSVLGCLAVVRADCINVRGRRYTWKTITDVTMDRPQTGSADKPALVLHIQKKNKIKQVVMVPDGMVDQEALAPLYHRVNQILKQAQAKISAQG